MRLYLQDKAVDLILYCLEQQASEFNEEEKKDYEHILHSIEIANDSTTYDF
jgi:hypothetical protein